MLEYKPKKLSDIGDIVTGKTPPTSDKANYGDGYMFISPTELHEGFEITDSEKHITEKGLRTVKSNSIEGTSVLVGCIGWDMGNVAICHEKCVTNQQINSITHFKQGYNPYYVYYWLLTKKDYLFSIASVTRTPILSKSTFQDIIIPIPDKQQQDRITDVLFKIDKKIQCNKRINDNLQHQLKLLYDYWFTQFDFPDENGNPYRASGGAMVWNEQLKRNIPINWRTTSIADNSMFQIIKPGIEKYVGDKVYLATADVVGTTILSGNIVDYYTRESRANMQPSMYSIWFAKMKKSIKHLYLGRPMNQLIENYILSTGFCGLKCSQISFEYVASFIEHSYFEMIKDTLAHGATQEAVNNDDLCNIFLLMPPDTVLQRYHDQTTDIYAQISSNICENQKLSSLRNWLLPMLMNGQATISD